MKFLKLSIVAVVCALMSFVSASAHAQIQSPSSNFYNLSPNTYYTQATPFTAASQTAAALPIAGANSAVIQIKASSLTTVTWALKCSIDGGTTFFSLPLAPIPTTTVPITTTALTETTTTANSIYVANVTGCAQLQFSTTSGTFTATSVTPVISVSRYKGYL